MTKRLVVLVSGSGSNLQSLMDACDDPEYGARVVAVGSDRYGIEGLARAERAGIPTFTHRVNDFETRDQFDEAVAGSVASYRPDLVVSAGYLKLLKQAFLAEFGGRYINTHNSLLPSFPGMRGPAAALEYGVKITGATLFLCDSGIDTGQIIAQVAVPVCDDDTVDTLTERIKVAEREQLVSYVGKMAREGWVVDGRTVRVGKSLTVLQWPRRDWRKRCKTRRGGQPPGSGKNQQTEVERLGPKSRLLTRLRYGDRCVLRRDHEPRNRP